MSDDRKTKAQLIKELEEIRQQFTGSETGHKQSKHKIQKVNEQLSAIIKTFDGLIYVCSRDYRIEFMTEQLIRRTGYDGTGELCYKVLHDRDSICPWCVNDRVFKGETVRREGKSLKDNRWYYIVNAPIYNEAGTVSMQAMILDITYRKRAEAALEESERRLADIIDFLPDATLAIDLSGKVIAWNRAMEEMSGVKAGDILGKGNYEHAVPFYGMRRPMLIDLVLEFIEGSDKKYDFVRREGNILLAETNVTMRGIPRALWGKAGPLYDICGNITGAIESVRDITALKQSQEALQKAHNELEIRIQERTAELVQANKALQAEISERKHAESVLKESEEKYNQFFRTSRDCVFITSKDGNWINVNDAAVELFGYSSREELMQSKVNDVYANPEERTKHISIIAEHGYTKEFPADALRKDGTVRHVLITSAARYDAEGNVIGFQGTIRDITERKRAEEERERFILELSNAMSKIKTLSGMLPICSSCKKIRDDKGYWNQIESYIMHHSEAEFSHSICPECAKKLYPEYYKKMYPEKG